MTYYLTCAISFFELQSEQGKSLLQSNNFWYRKAEIHKDVEYWRRIDKLHNGRLNMKYEAIIGSPPDHNHIADII